MTTIPGAAAAVTARAGAGLLAQENEPFLGEDFFPWMVLAFGAAMVVGNALALLRPPPADPADPGEGPAGPAARPPLARALVLMAIGLAAALWGLASLLWG